MHIAKSIARRITITTSFFVLIFSFNNCGPGYKPLDTVSLGSGQGTTGGEGDNGSTGTNGDTGSIGSNGDTGDTGDAGTGGDIGDTGDTGTGGDIGNTGDTGTGGDIGDTGTGDGGGTGGTGTGSDTNELAHIAFPPNGATSDSHIVVRGNSNSTVSKVVVNGVQATTIDNYASWRADVPLQVGTNNLIVDVISNGTSKSGVASTKIERFSSDSAIKRGSGGWAGRILGMSYDPINERFILNDDVEDGVWELHLSDGNRRMISGSESNKIGTGVDITFPTGVATAANQCYTVDTELIIKIDLNNGNRSLFTNGGTGFGDIYLSPDQSYLLTSQSPNDMGSIIKINTSNAVATVIASSSVGTGTSLRNMAGLGVSWALNKAYTTVYYDDAITSIDLTTGNRSTFSKATGSEPKFSDPRHIIVDDITGQAFVFDSKKLTAINLQTGRRAYIGNSGPLSSLTSIVTMTMTPYGPALLDYVPSYEGTPRSPTLILIDPIEGTRLILGR